MELLLIVGGYYILKALADGNNAADYKNNMSNKAVSKWKWQNLAEFAKNHGFKVTSTTGGRHNPNSKHGKGLAIDVRTKDKTPAQVSEFIAQAREIGIIVRDERTRPKNQQVWSGSHLHLEI